MTEQEQQIASEQNQAEGQVTLPEHPAKTVNSIITNICAVLEQADKLANHDNVSEKTALLRDALSKAPPSDLNKMLHHINAMYAACESMKITRIAFRSDVEQKLLVAIIGLQFGIREIELFATFDKEGQANMLKEFSGSLDLLNPNRIIMPVEGNS